MAWIEAGRPVTRGRNTISLERQVRIAVDTLVVLGVWLGVFVSLWFLLLPAAAGVGLIHAGVTDSCAMGILIAKLPFNRVSDSASVSRNSQFARRRGRSGQVQA